MRWLIIPGLPVTRKTSICCFAQPTLTPRCPFGDRPVIRRTLNSLIGWRRCAREGRALTSFFCSGNGLATIDDIWFEEARETDVLGMRVRVAPPEELIWQKASIMERERFDGADVAQLLANCASRIHWRRLIQRFEPDWRVLWSHLVLFGFIFPSKRHLIPLEVVKEFIQ
jgi:hypothetical protein